MAGETATAGDAPSWPELPTRTAVPPPAVAIRTAAAAAGQNLRFVV